MSTIRNTAARAALTLAALLFAAGCGDDGHDHGAHAEHDDGDAHDEHDEGAEHDEHAGDEHDEHGDHEGEERVELSAEQRARIGLATATAGPGTIERTLSFPGEVALNPDRVAHVVPRAPGIVREVSKTIGDTVEEDEILAWIESAELAEAKLDLYAREADVGRASVELPRARRVFENVNRLVELLETEPDEDALGALAGLDMGDYRGVLLTAYAGLVEARTVFERESVLREKAISSAQDLVSAQAAYQRARAEFAASLDTARFEVLVAFGEAVRARQVAEFGSVAAEQSLRLKGVDDATIARLRELAPRAGSLVPCDCGTEECEHVALPSLRDTLGADERLGWYALRAPFAGVVVEKHLTLGEKVGEDESVFAVADTATVWVELGVFQKDLADVAPGLPAVVEASGGGTRGEGTIASVAPVLDPDTRTARARVVMPNADGTLRPGLFVTVHVRLPASEAAVVVPRGAVQVLDERNVVFVPDGDGFLAVPVELGRGDRERVEVVSGLDPGREFVERGAFELKAAIATSGLDAHAGHGH